MNECSRVSGFNNQLFLNSNFYPIFEASLFEWEVAFHLLSLLFDIFQFFFFIFLDQVFVKVIEMASLNLFGHIHLET
jgi:hypothetical protein